MKQSGMELMLALSQRWSIGNQDNGIPRRTNAIQLHDSENKRKVIRGVADVARPSKAAQYLHY